MKKIEGNYSDELKNLVLKMLVKNQYHRITIDEVSNNPLIVRLKRKTENTNENPQQISITHSSLSGESVGIHFSYDLGFNRNI
jgi:serine/threonine protein kinase